MERSSPEQFNPSEQEKVPEHLVNKFVGANESARQKASDIYANLFEQGGATKDIEIPLTPEEKEIANETLKELVAFVVRYGCAPVSLDEKHVRMLVRDKRLHSPDESSAPAEFSVPSQRLSVFFKENKFDAAFASNVAHEALHAQSFISIFVKLREAGGISREERRMGFSLKVEKGERQIGDWLNEAMTEELNIRFMDQLLSASKRLGYQKELKRMIKEGIPQLDEREISGAFIDHYEGEVPSWTISKYGYKEERDKLNALLDDLAAKHPDRFPNREAAFDLFARAYFSGELLDIARLIEQTYGKGTFRKFLEGENIIGNKQDNTSETDMGIDIDWVELNDDELGKKAA